MQAKIETQDAAIIEQLQPLIQVVKTAPGHLNYYYSHGPEYLAIDVISKRRLCLRLRPILPPGWDMGTGAGHVWIAGPLQGTEARPFDRERVLLIID